MPTNYKDLSERDKQVSNLEHLDTLDHNTDDIEGLLADIKSSLRTDVDADLDAIKTSLSLIEGKLDTIEGDLTTINSSVGGTTHEVTTQGQAIVQAIQGQ